MGGRIVGDILLMSGLFSCDKSRSSLSDETPRGDLEQLSSFWRICL